MDADARSIESRLRCLEDTVSDLQNRLRALEGGRAAFSPAEAVLPPAEAAITLAAPVDATTFLPLVGRTFMVFGGAFLLRALTDAGRLPTGVGVGLALAYAVGWLVAAWRAAPGQRLSAAFHGVTGVLIGVPLITEATTRFALMTPWSSAASLAGLATLALYVAWRRDLQVLAAAGTLATLAAAASLVAAVSAFVPYSVVLVCLGVGTLWLGYDRDWFWLRWVTAFVADVAMVGLTTRAISPQHLEPATAVIVVQLGMLGLYLGSFAARTIWRGRVLVPFEVAQTVAALAVGLGGALAVAKASGTGVTGLGVGSLLFGAGAYAVAFAFVGRRQGLGANFYFYASLALLLSCVGVTVLAFGAPAAFCLALGGLAVGATWLGRRFSRNALVFHGSVYCVLSAVVSGTLSIGVAMFAGKAAGLWPAMSASAWVAMAATLTCLAISLPASREATSPGGLVPRLAFLVLAVLGISSAALLALGPRFAGVPPDPGTLATLRTALLAVAAVVLAAAGRTQRLADARWLVYPVLAAAAVKLLVEDMRLSQPATLFVALAMLGASLVVAPRLVRHVGSPGSGGPAPAA